jgi:NTE family protein
VEQVDKADFEESCGLKIGIALSGGGSRAVAFHLGCLRTLNRLKILDRAAVLSTVSGGSVIGAMYAVHEGSFDEFERLVHQVLRDGFVWPSIRTAVTTPEGLKALETWVKLLTISAAQFPFALLRWLSGYAAQIVRGRRIGPPPERWIPKRPASRTTILARTFDRLLFKRKTLGKLRTTGPRLIVVTAELRTRSAFYFGRRHAGSWRFGEIDPSSIPVAHAVAASAAYPLFLPALDDTFTFRRRDGSLRTERVSLTDGGAYDNLGLSPLWPGRDRDVSIGVEDVDIIVACRAGYGLRTADPASMFRSRMPAVFGSIAGRAENATANRLFDLKDSGRIRGFVMPYLDQDDKKLTCAPPDLVTRTAAADYPTDFSAMPEEWIEKLSKRGEQLTLAVIQQHAAYLLPPEATAIVPQNCVSTSPANMQPASI